MQNDPEKTTYTRREFNTFFALLLTMFTAASTTRAGIDAATKTSGKKKRPTKFATPEDLAGATLAIDFPAEEGWYIIHRLSHDDWKRINVEADSVSPKMARQLAAAKAAPWGTPVLCRVHGDPIAILTACRYFEPGEEDDRGPSGDDEGMFSDWRLEWFGDGIRRIAPDNTSWMQHRLAHGPEISGREIAFHDHWQHENGERGGINYGCGSAQDLMLSIYKYEKPEGFEPWLTNRERKILATFVQWLGTNCGQGFLHEVKRNGGMPGL